jgi:hypothetical protein
VTFVRYSEPYQPTGGLAAEGVINQLGRPDIESLEVLVREAVQNCWDARRATRRAIRVEIGRQELDAKVVARLAAEVFVDPPPEVPIVAELRPGMAILYFADFGTTGLGGPTRADQVVEGSRRDFVDFVRNIGQPPDNDFGGGSFGYGKAAFYIASRARTIVLDTLCETASGLERRLICAALGSNHKQRGHWYTGRHWWGVIVDGVPEPLTGKRAEKTAALLGLPPREGRGGLGTTVAVVSPGIGPEGKPDAVMPFVAEALAWNFWPRMISTPGGEKATMSFKVTDNGRTVRVPDPRAHPRLRGFVEAMDRLRADAVEVDPMVIDRAIACERPIQHLGRLVIQKGPIAAVDLVEGALVTHGMQITANAVHHVALMRNAELVVRYRPGPEPTTGRFGYSGVFRCSLDTDQAFRSAEPPTHDDWIARAVTDRHDRTFVNVALSRIARACREAAGYGTSTTALSEGPDVPLGEFADGLARLMPGFAGPGARQARPSPSARRRRRNAPGTRATDATEVDDHAWVDGDLAWTPVSPSARSEPSDTGVPVIASSAGSAEASRPKPTLRSGGDPHPSIAADGTPVLRYPFELRARSNEVRLSATAQVMTNDGESVEAEPPRGWVAPEVRAWIDPAGQAHVASAYEVSPDSADGSWVVELPILEDVVVGIDILAEVIP